MDGSMKKSIIIKVLKAQNALRLSVDPVIPLTSGVGVGGLVWLHGNHRFFNRCYSSNERRIAKAATE